MGTSARIYARYSTENQSEQSAVDQIRVCREYARKLGWTVAAEYADEGISGSAIGNRPGIRRFLADVQGLECLLVVDLSRLSRSQDLAPLLARLTHRGVRVIGVQDGFDSSARHARMQAGLSGILSEEYRAQIKDRVHSALEMRARQGRRTGALPYQDTGIVREVFTRAAAGDRLIAIVSDLNARSVVSPGVNRRRRTAALAVWTTGALKEILRNERYAGRVVWNKRRWVKDPDTGKHRCVQRPEAEWIETTCEPMVDAATFAKVQARFARRVGTRGGMRRHALSGLLLCATCGSRMIIKGTSGRQFFTCGARAQGGAPACANRVTVRVDRIESALLEPLAAQMLSPQRVAEGVQALAEARRVAIAEANREGPTAEQREVAALERMVRDGMLSAETARPALDALKARVRLQAKAALPDLPLATADAWRAGVAELVAVLRGKDVEAAREALRGIYGIALVSADEGGAWLEFQAANEPEYAVNGNVWPTLYVAGHRLRRVFIAASYERGVLDLRSVL